MSKFQDTGEYSSNDNWAQRRQETGIWSLDDPEYNDAYFRQNTNSMWELPSSPLTLNVNLQHADQDVCREMARELEEAEGTSKPQALHQLSLYAERLEGEIQYLIINDTRFETVDELPDSIRTYLDDLTFGDAISPVVNAMGSRINLWDVLRGEPETQQALADAGVYNEEGEINLTGVYDSATTLDELDSKGNINLNNSTQTRVVDMQVKKHLEQKDQMKTDKKKGRLFLVVAVCVMLSAVAAAILFMN